MRQAAAPKVTASVRSPDVDLHKWGKQTTKVRELRRWEKHAHTWAYVSFLMCVKGRWCILGVHDANKKRKCLAQNIFGLRLHYASSCMWSIYEYLFKVVYCKSLYLRSECKWQHRRGSDWIQINPVHSTLQPVWCFTVWCFTTPCMPSSPAEQTDSFQPFCSSRMFGQLQVQPS